MYKKGIYSLLSILVLFGAGCKREELVGEKKVFVSSNPLVENTGITVSNTNPDSVAFNKMNGSSVSFAAAFTTEVSWEVLITGKSSNAYKKIRGTGKTIDNTNSIWQGDATSIQFFMKNDSCTAQLFVAGIDTAIASTGLVIKSLMSYNYRTVDGVRYLLVDDYDGDYMGTLPMQGLSGDVADLGTPKYVTTEKERINGKSAFHIEGTDINNNGWLFSMNHKDLVEMVNTTDTNKNIASTNPNDFYINIYIRGTGKANSSVELKVYEFDAARSRKNLVDTIKTGGFVFTIPEQAKNDGWIYDIVVDWEGWKLVSIPYYKFRVANDLTKGGSGNHIKEPWKITAMAVSLLSYPLYGQEVAVDVDFVVLSEGGPFVPKY